MRRDILLVIIGAVLAATGAKMGAIVATAQTVSPTQVTTGPPVVENGTLQFGQVKTIVTGIGRGWLVYTLTNESMGDPFRCMYGSTTGDPPTSPPTVNNGSLVRPGVSLVERTAPSNRLDCIAVSGNPKYGITMYPR